MGPSATSDTSPKEALNPPQSVRGMTALDREAFKTAAAVPYVEVPASSIGNLMKSIRDCLLKLRDVKPIADSGSSSESKLLLLDPRRYSNATDLDDNAKKALCTAGVDVAAHCGTTSVRLSYDSWSAEEILRAVLPAGAAVPSSFSIIGHVAHVNLKDHLLPYRHVIGQVLLDKNKCLKTVVNKVDTIDNTFRNFAMEVLAGEPNMDVTVKENGCVYQFDFSKVYWNPRLSTEHERIIAIVGRHDVVYDMFAGVGPFSVPAAKKKATVLANDLNGESYKHLCSNFALNKVKGSYSTFNLDGRVFMRTVVKADVTRRLAAAITAAAADEPSAGSTEQHSLAQIHIVMNLPALAADFLDSLPGLLSDCFCDCIRRLQPSAGHASVLGAAAGDDAAAVAGDAGHSSPAAATAGDDAGCSSSSRGGGGGISGAADAANADHAAPATPGVSAAPRAAASGSEVDVSGCNMAAERQKLSDGDGSDGDAGRHSCAAAGQLRRRPLLVHCYSFGKGEDESIVRAQVAERMNAALQSQVVSPAQVRHVRNVAPNKDMFCATFPLPADVLLGRLRPVASGAAAVATLPSSGVTAAAVAAWQPATSMAATADEVHYSERGASVPAAAVAAGGSHSANEPAPAESGADVAAGDRPSEQPRSCAHDATVLLSSAAASSAVAAADSACSRQRVLAAGKSGDSLLATSVEAEASDPPPKKVKVFD